MNKRTIGLRRGAGAAGCALSMLALCVALPAQASHVGEEVGFDEQTVGATDQLLGALRQFENAPPAVQAARTQQLVQLAQARQERLLRLLERNPRLATLRLLPPGLRERFPAAARDFLEEEVRGTGSVFARVADDFERSVSRKQFFFQAGPGNSAVALQLAEGDERDLLGWAGKRVSVQGVRIGGQLLIRSAGEVVALDGATTTSSTGSVVSTTPKVQGAQKTLVILTNFSDKPLSCTAADVQNRVFGSTGSTVNTAFQQSSRNLVSFNGTVVGPFTINYASTGSCDYSGWGSAAEAAARAAGVDPSQYQRVNYVTPGNGSCGWSGLAYMPGRQSWVQSCGSTGIYTHELGHNLSLHHAVTPTSEYGDGTDPMGPARNVRHNGANQAMTGWLPTGGLIDVFNGGSYAIQALGVEAGTQPQVLRLVKTDTKEYYYVSMRQALGVDAALPSASLNAVSVHRATGTLPAKTVLLATLAVGQSYSDATNGIQLTHQGVSGNTATVGVTMSGSSCARSAPAVTVSPSSQSGSPGTARSYTVSVKNTNSAACGTSSFALGQQLPAGFSGSLSASSLAIAAGATASASWTVSSSSASLDGTATLDLTAADSAGAATTAHASYVVMRDGTAPSIVSVSPPSGSAVSGRSTTLSAAVTDNIGVARVEFWVNAKLLASDSSAPFSAGWNLRKTAKGPATVNVRAFDAAGNRADWTGTVTVN